MYSYLAHLSEFTVAEGAMVERGQRIALSGATGRVTGPHLHWTMRFGSARVDPLSLVEVLQQVRRECLSRQAAAPTPVPARRGLVSHFEPATPPGQLTCMLRAQL